MCLKEKLLHKEMVVFTTKVKRVTYEVLVKKCVWYSDGNSKNKDIGKVIDELVENIKKRNEK